MAYTSPSEPLWAPDRPARGPHTPEGTPPPSPEPASPPQRRSPAGQDVTDNYLSPEDKFIKVWPTPIKNLRDEVVRFKREWDILLRVQENVAGAEYLKPEEFVHDLNEEDRMNNKINDSSTLRRLYQGTRLKCLNPRDFRILSKNGRPYIVGRGSKGIIFLAQNERSRTLVAIKTFASATKAQREGKIDGILLEVGFTHKGGTILEQHPDILPCYIQGFLKVKPRSRLTNYYLDIMPVTVLSSLVPDVPMCLPLSYVSHAASSFATGRSDYQITISNADWARILSLIVEAMLILNKGGVVHNDVAKCNMCVVYKPEERKYGLSILDFGRSYFIDSTQARILKVNLNDVIGALGVVQTFAQYLEFENTKQFASSIIEDPNILNRETILSDLDKKLELDLGPIPLPEDDVEDDDDGDGDSDNEAERTFSDFW